jgi:predicted ribosome quality control (RQC) complex YloA/Tae2 family protein
MLSLGEIRAVVSALEPLLLKARIQKIVQPDESTLVLELYGWDSRSDEGVKRRVVLSAHPQFGRITLSELTPQAPPWPPDFAQWVKAHLNRAIVEGVRVINDDRQVGLLFKGKEASHELVLSLMGPRSNVYALDLDGKLLAAMRPLESTRPDLSIGEPWANPAKPPGAGEGSNRWSGLGGATLLSAIAVHYETEEARREFEELRDKVARVIGKELEFAQRKASNLRNDLEGAKEARDEKRQGELLKQAMARIQPGATSVTAHDYETGEDVTIELDPRLSPSENLERYFKRYHKGLVGTNILGQQLEITRTHINELEQLKAQMAGISRRSEMRQFADQPAVVALRKKHTPEDFKPSRPPKKVPEKKDVPNRLMPKRYRTSDGLEVWVGKSDEGNDYLTTKLANGNDWFFHVEGYPGSHTILRTGGRKDPPQESVLEAAELCAHFSKLKDARKLDVHVAPIKQVHKPKGAKPGLVYVTQGKSIGLRRDPARLKRILDARTTEQAEG